MVEYTANIYSQFTVNGCVTCATVIWQWLLQVTTVQMTFNDTEEYSLKSIAILGCKICSQIAVAHVTLLKAVLSTVEIFAVYNGICRYLKGFIFWLWFVVMLHTSQFIMYKQTTFVKI